jgi:hypothetical protein
MIISAYLTTPHMLRTKTNIKIMISETDLETSSSSSASNSTSPSSPPPDHRQKVPAHFPNRLSHAIITLTIAIYYLTLLLLMSINYTPQTPIEQNLLAQFPVVVLVQNVNFGIGNVAMECGLFDEGTAHPQLARVVFGGQFLVLVLCVLVQVVLAVVGA